MRDDRRLSNRLDAQGSRRSAAASVGIPGKTPRRTSTCAPRRRYRQMLCIAPQLDTEAFHSACACCRPILHYCTTKSRRTPLQRITRKSRRNALQASTHGASSTAGIRRWLRALLCSSGRKGTSAATALRRRRAQACRMMRDKRKVCRPHPSHTVAGWIESCGGRQKIKSKQASV